MEGGNEGMEKSKGWSKLGKKAGRTGKRERYSCTEKY